MQQEIERKSLVSNKTVFPLPINSGANSKVPKSVKPYTVIRKLRTTAATPANAANLKQREEEAYNFQIQEVGVCLSIRTICGSSGVSGGEQLISVKLNVTH